MLEKIEQETELLTRAPEERIWHQKSLKFNIFQTFAHSLHILYGILLGIFVWDNLV